MVDLSADTLGKELADALDEIDSLRGNQLVLARQVGELVAALHKIEQETIDHVAVKIARSELAKYKLPL